MENSENYSSTNQNPADRFVVQENTGQADNIDEVLDMFKKTKNDTRHETDYDDIDQILSVFNGSNSSSKQQPIQTSQQYSQTAPEKTTNSKPSASIQDEMRKKSTSGKYSSNKRYKTTTTKKWHRTAIGVALAASMFVGGLLSRPLEEVVDYLANGAELKKMTTSFEENIIEKNKSKTFTNDVSLDHQKIADAIEADGLFTNQELFMAVDTIGEVQTNNVLNVATNPPAENVETYMRNNNISNMKDWKDKTIRSMSAIDNVTEAQDELNSIFRDENNRRETAEDYTDSTTYGGK